MNCAIFRAENILRSKEGDPTSSVYVSVVGGGGAGIEKLHQKGGIEMDFPPERSKKKVGTNINIHLRQRSLGHMWRTGGLC